jgi:hypothetical protein
MNIQDINDIHKGLRERHPHLKEMYDLKHKYINEGKYEKAVEARTHEKELILKYITQEFYEKNKK